MNAFPLPCGAVFVTPSGTLRLAEQPHWTGENIEVHRGRGDLPEARELIIYRIEACVPTTAPPTSSRAVGREFRPRVAGGVPRGLATRRWRGPTRAGRPTLATSKPFDCRCSMSPLERRPLDESTSMCWAHLVVYLEERQTPLVASGACSDRGSFISHTEHLLRARNREVTPPALLQIGNSGRWTPWALLRFGREPAPPAYPTPSTWTAAVWASGAEVRRVPGVLVESGHSHES